jgi:broad specificity phosphatase PhoE
VCPPEGETLHDARARLRPILQRLSRKHKQAAVALVVPEPLATLLHGLLTDQEVSRLWPTSKAGGASSWESLPLAVR